MERVTAKLDGKNLGSGINALANEGKLVPASISFSDGRPDVHCNSTWAATDWLEANGFYKDGPPCRHQIYW